MAAATTTTDARITDRAIARTLPLMPRTIVRRLSAPYIAGELLEEAERAIRRLAAAGFVTTLDVLGEAITTRAGAEGTRDAYLQALDRLALLGDPDLVNVSVKPTALGLAFDGGLTRELVRQIVEAARDRGGFVRVDMEDSPYTDATLDMYDELRDAGFDNVGVVLQAYLKRSAADAERLAARGARVRIVKGIYIEPEAIAWREMPRINQSFVELGETLLDAGCHVAFATHDDDLVERTQRVVAERGTPRDGYEYQMLLGVREQLRDSVRDAGHRLRVYVPFGAQWYEYSLRRLRENPRVAGHVAADVFSRFRRRAR